MGSSFDARCRACDETFTVSKGGGFTFQLQHCDTCGKERALPTFQKLEAVVDEAGVEGKCGCGGRFTFDAPPRCPKCRSTDYEDLGNHIDYD